MPKPGAGGRPELLADDAGHPGPRWKALDARKHFGLPVEDHVEG